MHSSMLGNINSNEEDVNHHVVVFENVGRISLGSFVVILSIIVSKHFNIMQG